MLQTKKLLALAVVLAALISVATIAYENYIQDEIYQESADHLLETYGQVAKTFTLFAQRNWNVLADWDSELQSIADAKDVAALWQELVERKNSWQYSDFYMFNEDCQFLTASGRQGTQDSIRSAFLEMYEKKEPCVSAYIASSDQRKIVFAIPLSEAFTLDGVTYTGVAVSYDNDVVERLLGEVIFDGESDCYIARVDGSILLSLEPETEFSEGMEDLFGFLEAKTMMPQEDQSRVQQDSMKFEYCDQDQNIYKVMHVIPMEWDAEGTLTKVMMIAQDIGERVALETMANTDGLTGLFNGRYFGTVLQEKEKKKFPFVLFYLDLDRFKPINDTYGHDMGDKLLKEVAARLQRCIRSKDHAFRIGGDEFALLVSADLDEAHCQQLRDRIRQELSQPFYLEGQVLHVGVSCGYAAYPRDSSRATEVRILADQRMYAQKEEHHGDGPASGPAKR